MLVSEIIKYLTKVLRTPYLEKQSIAIECIDNRTEIKLPSLSQWEILNLFYQIILLCNFSEISFKMIHTKTFRELASQCTNQSFSQSGHRRRGKKVSKHLIVVNKEHPFLSQIPKCLEARHILAPRPTSVKPDKTGRMLPICRGCKKPTSKELRADPRSKQNLVEITYLSTSKSALLLY